MGKKKTYKFELNDDHFLTLWLIFFGIAAYTTLALMQSEYIQAGLVGCVMIMLCGAHVMDKMADKKFKRARGE